MVQKKKNAVFIERPWHGLFSILTKGTSSVNKQETRLKGWWRERRKGKRGIVREARVSGSVVYKDTPNWKSVRRVDTQKSPIPRKGAARQSHLTASFPMDHEAQGGMERAQVKARWLAKARNEMLSSANSPFYHGHLSVKSRIKRLRHHLNGISMHTTHQKNPESAVAGAIRKRALSQTDAPPLHSCNGWESPKSGSLCHFGKIDRVREKRDPSFPARTAMRRNEARHAFPLISFLSFFLSHTTAVSCSIALLRP